MLGTSWRQYWILHKLVSRAPVKLRKTLKKLVFYLQEVDAGIAKFREKTGMGCLNGCGKCCETPDVETTALEMLPAALAIWEAKAVDIWLEKLTAKDFKGTCVFYQPDPARAGFGRCGRYETRPAICRLYSYSARKNKDGGKSLMTCKVMKEHFPQTVDAAQKTVNAGLPVPINQDVFMKIHALDPSLSNQLMPINQALAEAIRKIANTKEYWTKKG